jgi:hypothetical protein
MDFITPLIKTGFDLLKIGLGAERRRLSKRKYKQIVSGVIAELLKQHPDLDSAEAQLAAIQATDAVPDTDFLRAASMLKSALGHSRRRTMTAAKKVAARARWARQRSPRKKRRPAKASRRKRSSRLGKRKT